MKRLLIALLLIALLLPTSALAESRTIDLSTMTLDELTALKNEVSAAITTLSAEVVDGYALVENYGEYARNPDPHVGEKIRFNGSVEQVIEGVESTTYRIAKRTNERKWNRCLFNLSFSLLESNYTMKSGKYQLRESRENTVFLTCSC